MNSRFFAFAILVGLMSGLQVEAHHSFGGTYDVARKETIKGTLVQVSLRSPHSFLYVEVEDANKAVQRWMIEGAGATQFAQQGLNKDSFKIGDPVEVVINPSRSPNSTRGRLIRITRTTDGYTWGGRTGEVVN
jgi:hypothetical protein